jgi:ribonuclease HI
MISLVPGMTKLSATYPSSKSSKGKSYSLVILCVSRSNKENSNVLQAGRLHVAKKSSPANELRDETVSISSKDEKNKIFFVFIVVLKKHLLVEKMFFSWLSNEQSRNFGITKDFLSLESHCQGGASMTISSDPSLEKAYTKLIQAASRIRPDLEQIIRSTPSTSMLQQSAGGGGGTTTNVCGAGNLTTHAIEITSSVRGRKRERSNSSSRTIVYEGDDDEGGKIEMNHSTEAVVAQVAQKQAISVSSSAVISTSISSMQASNTFEEEVLLFFDGGARGNPGKAAGAAYLRVNRGVKVAYVWSHIPFATNNEAEYLGLILGLQAALHLGFKRVSAFGDSLLVVNQFNGSWQCTKPHLQSLLRFAKEIARKIPTFSLAHIVREQNIEADRLSNCGMDSGRGTVASTYDGVSQIMARTFESFVPKLPFLSTCRQATSNDGLPYYERI